MKRLIIIGVLLFALSLAAAPLSLAAPPPTTDTRNMIHFTGGTFDISDVVDLQNGSVGLTYHSEGPIPGEIGDFNQVIPSIVIASDGDITYSLTINSVAIATDRTISNDSHFYNFSFMIGLGISATATTVDITLTVNNTNWIYAVGLVGNDVPANPAFFNEYVTFEEIDIGDPSVDGFWQVTDRVTNNIGIDFTDTNFTIGYPACVNDPDPNPWEGIDFLDTNNFVVSYQKYGPAKDEGNIDVEDTADGATVTLASDDEISDVNWEIDPTDEVWDDAFDGIDYDTLDVELNGYSVDWEEGSIVMNGLDVNEGDNEFVFTWTEAETGGTGGTDGTTPAPTAPYGGPGINWDAEVAEGVPTWAAVAIGIVVLFTIIAVVSIEKK